MPIASGQLYIVATPIGNLADISARASSVLAQADLVLAEDTRRTRVLLDHIGARPRMESLHEHNERERIPAILSRLAEGLQIALVSDAGTPLISDPGYPLVAAARDAGYAVVPIPGASAVITALSVAGLPTDRFAFEGFLPAKTGARNSRLEALQSEPRTLVFYESPHRVLATLGAMRDLFGAERRGCYARELTKRFETVRTATLAELCAQLEADEVQRQGEFVLVVEGAPQADPDDGEQALQRVLQLLLDELPVKQAAKLAAKLTGTKRNRAYELALSLTNKD